MNTKKVSILALIVILSLSVCSSAFAGPAIPPPELPLPTEIVDGVPLAKKFHDFWSYSTQLLDQLGFPGFGDSAGVGQLDIVLLTQAGGQTNPAPFENPAPSVTGGTSSFTGSWGAGVQTGGPVLVDDLLTYLHTEFDADTNIPVFIFDMVEPGSSTGDLEMKAKFSVFDPLGTDVVTTPEDEREIAIWTLDINNDFITVLDDVNYPGISKTYHTSHAGSGKHDYLVFAPTMNLDQFVGKAHYSSLEFHINAEMRLLNGGGEEAFISGATAAPDIPSPPTAIPEPTTLALMGIGLTGLAFRHRKK